MKIFWTKKQYNQFRDLLVQKSYSQGIREGLREGREKGIASTMKAIRENYILKERENKTNV